MRNYQILKSESELRHSEKKFASFIHKASKLKFWKQHFKKHQFRVDLRKFNWQNWQSYPYVTKQDFLEIGLTKRLSDSEKIIRRKPKRFILQSTSGTSQMTKPVLFVKNVDWMVEGDFHGEGNRMLILYQPRAISLRDAIALINQSSKNKIIQSLVVNPFRYDDRMTEAIAQFKPDSTITFPACLSFLVSIHKNSIKFLSGIKHVWLSGDFISQPQRNFIDKKMPGMKFDLDYITSEVDTIGMCCSYLSAKYGSNAYHPFKERLIELVNIDESGFGEIVITKTFPIELAFIRYKTGDLGRAVHEACFCGEGFTLFLEGRKNMDYIKQLGVLITRAEIERVLKKITKIKEWRGEVREVEVRKMLLGELTLELILKDLSLTGKDELEKIRELISDQLYLTPNKTLADLVKEGKFMPLKIKIVSDFPLTSKKAPLRKTTN